MSHIYRKASMVISWLGPADEDSNRAIPLMQRLNKLRCFDDMQGYEQCSRYSDFMGQILGEDCTIQIDSIPVEQFERLTRFLARNYFSRCWVLQEVMLAQRICMLCGIDIVDFADLQKVALLVAWIKKHRFHDKIGQALALPFKRNRYYDHEKAILELFEDRWRLIHTSGTDKKALPFTFEQLLTLARISGCENPKDKIFALLGIVPPGAFGLSPDYSKTTEQVYIEALRSLIEETKRLKCLSWVTDKAVRRFSDFPTWVGEFDEKADQSELAFESVDYKATFGSELDVSNIALRDNRVLRNRGVEIDRIVELAEPWEWHGTFSKFDPRWTTLTLKLPKMYRSTGQTRGEALVTTLVANNVDNLPLKDRQDMDHFKHVVRRLTSAAVIRHFHRLFYYPDTLRITTNYEATVLSVLHEIDILFQGDNTGFIISSSDVRDAEEQSCTCKTNLSNPGIGRTSPLRPPSDSECPYIAEFHRPDPSGHPYKTSINDRIPRIGTAVTGADIKVHWRDHSYGSTANRQGRYRRLARTKNGYLGLVPTSCEVEDAVWLLQGADVPYVLRESKRHTAYEKTGRVWDVMGDAYIHGAMQGEVWKDVKGQLVDIELV